MTQQPDKAANGMSHVTAIIPTFNRAHYLGESLEAVLSQIPPAQQVIVLDDGSDDDTAQIVADFGSRVEYYHQHNAGKSAALNRALGFTRGDAVWIVDDDDIVVPGALGLLQAALDRKPKAGFAFGHYDNFTVQNGERRYAAADRRFADDQDLFWSVLTGCYIFHPAMLVRKSIYDAVGPFDEKLARAQDFDMLLRLVRHAPAVGINTVLFHQRQHQGTRGPAALPIPGAEVWRRQHEWDRRVIAQSYRETELLHYLPRRPDRAHLTPHMKARALVRRALLMGRSLFWKEAIVDLARALRIDIRSFYPLCEAVYRALRSGKHRAAARRLRTFFRRNRGRTVVAHLRRAMRRIFS